jgi:autotransporter-associated beta strand protein
VALGEFTLSTGARADSQFSGTISGLGSLVKRGADTTFNLTGSNTYNGSTWVAEGTLAIGNGGTTGALAGTSGFVVDGTLQVRRADRLSIDQPISGSGALELLGTDANSTLTLQGSNKTHSGSTRVRVGRLVTLGDEALSDLSDLVVDATGSVLLGGAETVRSVSAKGVVDIASRLTSTGTMELGGAVHAAGTAALRLEAAAIEAPNPGNRWGANLSLSSAGTVNLSAGTDAGQRQPLSLGAVQAGGGGRIEASTLTLNGPLSVAGGTLVLDVDKGEVTVEPTGTMIGKLTPANRQIALTEDVLTQGPDGSITVSGSGRLDVRASRGGSVALQAGDNRFEGNGLSVVVGDENQPWAANAKPGAGSIELSVQNQVRVSGVQVDVGGAGIQADMVTVRAGGVRTLGDSRIVAKLPYDNQVGSNRALPALIFDLTDLAFETPGSYGVAGSGINISVGSKLFGDRSLLPVDGGYLTVLPLGGARGSTALLLVGPIVGGTYSFFYSGAGQQNEVPVFYNGVSAVTPQVSGSISSTVSVSEGARKERFDEAVRTENVALRLRSGVIAEVGPGRPATVSTSTLEGLRPPLCSPVPGTLACGP